MPNQLRKNILITIDVEDWFQVENLRPWFPASKWNDQVSRVASNTKRLLDLFDSYERPIKATFFILGWIGRSHPELILEVKNRGHEIASHGNAHILNDHMDEKRLWQDLESSKKLLEDISGTEVRGYRAPSFSINNRVLKIVQKCGYLYDSSYNSFDKHGRYGCISTNGYEKKGIAIKYDHQFSELPISNLRLLNQTLPWGGGGYFRFFPLNFFLKGIHQILKTHDAYLFYMHPWEIDPKQPRVKATKGLAAWRHYLNLDKTYTRLSKMISRFETCNFITCSQYLDTLNP